MCLDFDGKAAGSGGRGIQSNQSHKGKYGNTVKYYSREKEVRERKPQEKGLATSHLALNQRALR